MVVQVILLTRNANIPIIRFIVLFPITKYFIFSVENLEERDEHFEESKNVP